MQIARHLSPIAAQRTILGWNQTKPDHYFFLLPCNNCINSIHSNEQTKERTSFQFQSTTGRR